MRDMETHLITRHGTSGYMVILVGAVGFIVSCFLPFMTVGVPVDSGISLVRLSTAGPVGAVAAVGSVIHLFVGLVVLAWIAVVGIVRPRPWTAVALIAASIVWSLIQAGSLISWIGFYGPRDPAVGYWLILVSVLVVIAGTAMVWVSSRRAEMIESTQV
jgi:hypothetical protein